MSAQQAAALRAAIMHVLEPRGLSLGGGPWLKPLGQGLHEFRVRHTAHDVVSMYAAAGEPPPPTPERILLRVFVHFYGDRLVLLLHGYDKGADDSPRRQQREIAEARRRLRAWRQAQPKASAAVRGDRLEWT